MTALELATDTAHGPARYSVSADGLLSLHWRGTTINRVEYRSRHGDFIHTDSLAYRTDGKEPSAAALSALRREYKRLTPLLVTPEATARAGVAEARAELAHHEKVSREAQEAEAAARTALATAVIRLAAFEPLKAERLDELESGAA